MSTKLSESIDESRAGILLKEDWAHRARALEDHIEVLRAKLEHEEKRTMLLRRSVEAHVAKLEKARFEADIGSYTWATRQRIIDAIDGEGDE